MNTYTRLFPENVLSRILIYLSGNLSVLVIFEKKKKRFSQIIFRTKFEQTVSNFQ